MFYQCFWALGLVGSQAKKILPGKREWAMGSWRNIFFDPCPIALESTSEHVTCHMSVEQLRRRSSNSTADAEPYLLPDGIANGCCNGFKGMEQFVRAHSEGFSSFASGGVPEVILRNSFVSLAIAALDTQNVW